jgi:hypothetical protein
MRILKHPRVVAWLAGSFVIMCLSAILSIYGPDKTYMTVITILRSLAVLFSRYL